MFGDVERDRPWTVRGIFGHCDICDAPDIYQYLASLRPLCMLRLFHSQYAVQLTARSFLRPSLSKSGQRMYKGVDQHKAGGKSRKNRLPELGDVRAEKTGTRAMRGKSTGDAGTFISDLEKGGFLSALYTHDIAAEQLQREIYHACTSVSRADIRGSIREAE